MAKKVGEMIYLVFMGILGAVTGFIILHLFIMVLNDICEDMRSSYSTEDSYQTYTKQVCDYTGYNSRSIIEEMAQQGYMFTGTTKTFMCENTLNFQLRER